MVATLALALATVWLAVVTHRMATSTGKLVALESRPYMTLETIAYVALMPSSTASVGAVQIELRFANTSRVLTQYTVKDISLSLDGRITETPLYLNRGGFVYPGEKATFRLCPIDRIDSVQVIHGILNYTIGFQSPGKKGLYTSHRKLALVRDANGFNWTYLEQSEQEQ
jgi:hypothetical protein